jgi:hypothetical protein
MPFSDVCLVDRQSCPNEWPVFRFQQFTEQSQTVELREECGDPVDLTGRTVSFVAKDRWGKQTADVAKAMTVIDAESGQVQLSLTPAESADPGIFLGEVTLYNGDTAVRRFRCYLEITENLDSVSGRSRGLTIAEIRMAIMDRCDADNFLLDNVEFSDTQIVWAIRRPVDLWNDMPPDLRLYYTSADFPYRYYWVNGVIGELLAMAAHNSRRNNLRYSAANLTVDDKSDAPEYQREANELRSEYKQWVLLTKRAININRAWGGTAVTSFGNISRIV